MPPVRACNVQKMYDRMHRVRQRIVPVSAHLALAFQERISAILRDAPRIRESQRQSGVLTVETVADILRQAQEFIHALGLDVDVYATP